MAKVCMKPPDGGEPKEVEGGSEDLVRLMIAGWHQATQPPAIPQDAVLNKVEPQKGITPQEVKGDAS